MESFRRKLILEDKTVLEGEGFGGKGERVFELVSNTAMVGYEGIISDLSYLDQGVVMSYPLIGNYGVTDDDYESKNPGLGALIVREYNDLPSNFRYTKTLSETLEENDIPGISGVDTRFIVQTLRGKRGMKAMITKADTPLEQALEQIKNYRLPCDLIARASCKKRWYSRTANPEYNVIIIDCGVKLSIIKALNKLGCNVTVLPYNATAKEIISVRPCGLIISNGPGDPQHAAPVIELVRQLRGRLPMLGIGLGHQIIALAYGAAIIKMPSGHRGANHPVVLTDNGSIITPEQNHGYAVTADSLIKSGIQITYTNLLDNTVEGLSCATDKLVSVQFIPEPSNVGVYAQFTAYMDQNKSAI